MELRPILSELMSV